MHADDQHLLVVTSVEDSNTALARALREAISPQEVVVQLAGFEGCLKDMT